MKTKLYYFAYGFLTGIRMMFNYDPVKRMIVMNSMPIIAADSFMLGELCGSALIGCSFISLLMIGFFYVWSLI